MVLVWRLEGVPGALIISTHLHTLSLGRDDSHLPTQTMQLLAAGSLNCCFHTHNPSPVSAVLSGHCWGYRWNISTLKIDNMCFYILKLLGRISFIVVNIVGKLLIKIPEWWWQVLYNNGNNGSRRWLHFTAASLKYFLIFLQIFLFVLWDSRS